MYNVDQCVELGAKIISLSLGTTSYNHIATSYLQEIYDEGILLISAAGNLGDSTFSYPASYVSSMSVAAIKQQPTTNSYAKATFSQYNNQVEISAPGVNIWSTYMDNGYVSFDGTSMATPHVSGVAGLLWMYFPECTNQQIRNVLDLSSKPIIVNNCNANTGYGLVQAMDAYAILSEGDCGGYASITYAKGGCEQIDTYSLSCSTDSDCNDDDPCTVDSCSAETGACTTSMDCSQCQKDGLVSVTIQPDDYPSETTWVITDDGSSTSYASGGPYSQMIQYTTDICLSFGSYTFTIYDSVGDGLCCEGGDGSYKLSLDNVVLKTGAFFDVSESTIINIANNSPTNKPTTTPPTNSPTNKPPTTAPKKKKKKKDKSKKKKKKANSKKKKKKKKRKNNMIK